MSTATKSRATRKTASPPPQAIEPSEIYQDTADHDRQAMIAQAAFFIAEARGFAPGQEFDDWLAAERMLAQPADSDTD